MKGRPACYHHGGKTPNGIAAPGLRHGRYSKDLSVNLAAQYQQALDDPTVHSILDEIALTETRLRVLLQRCTKGDLGKAWEQLDEEWRVFVVARAAQDAQGMRESLQKIATVIDKGRTDYLLWGEISDKIKLLAELRLKEHKRLLDLESVMTADRALLVFGMLKQAVYRAVTHHADAVTARAILTAVQDDIRTFDTRSVAQPRVYRGDGPTDVVDGAAYTDLSGTPV